MKTFNVEILTAGLSEELASMLTRHLTDHMKAWCESTGGAAFQIDRKEGAIRMRMNSVELFGKYIRYEEPYVEYFRGIDTAIVESREDQDFDLAA